MRPTSPHGFWPAWLFMLGVVVAINSAVHADTMLPRVLGTTVALLCGGWAGALWHSQSAMTVADVLNKAADLIDSRWRQGLSVRVKDGEVGQ